MKIKINKKQKFTKAYASNAVSCTNNQEKSTDSATIAKKWVDENHL